MDRHGIERSENERKNHSHVLSGMIIHPHNSLKEIQKNNILKGHIRS